MAKYGRNSLCPCGSGRKYKTCCYPSYDEKTSRPVNLVPLPFSRSRGLYLPSKSSHEINGGKDREFITFEKGITLESWIDPDKPRVNIGQYAWPDGASDLCGYLRWDGRKDVLNKNRARFVFSAMLGHQSLKPSFRVVLHPCQLLYVSAPSKYTSGSHHVVGTYDGEVLRLFVDGEEVARAFERGVICRTWGRFSLAGEHPCRAWLGACSAEQIRWLSNIPPSDDQSFFGDVGSTLPELLGSVPARKFVHRDQRTLNFARRILQEAGDSPSTSLPDNQLRSQAGTKITTCCDELESLLNDRQATEINLLKFFRDNPHAAFLIEVDTIRIWREKEIQGYGRIDFVFMTTEGSGVAVEIEGPEPSIFRKDNEFTRRFYHAIDQVSQWRLGADKLPDVLRNMLGAPKLRVTRALVIIGRNIELDNPKRVERWDQYRLNSNVTVKTWDNIIDRGRNIARILGDPVLTIQSWNE